jgi:hypothetical protein
VINEKKYVYARLLTVIFSSYSADAKGSRFIQQAVDGATTEEIIMVYEGIVPYVRTLAVCMFGNHAVQKVKVSPTLIQCVHMFFFFFY